MHERKSSYMKVNRFVAAIIGITVAMSTSSVLAANVVRQSGVVLRPVYGDNVPNVYMEERWERGARPQQPKNRYVGARFDLTLSSFNQTFMLVSDPSDTGRDNFSMERMLGFDVTAGYRFHPKWRAEINYGYTGTYEDNDIVSFSIGAQYLTLNGIYTIREWTTTSIYTGAGVGIGFLATKFSAPGTFDLYAKTDKLSTGFAGQLQIGMEEKVSDNLVLGAYYKLGYITGHSQDILMGDQDIFRIKTSGLFMNTFGLGIRVLF
ncbi:MAG: porin family protein [Alphaproteobacteria bacterium]|nr:porin family protein [Alphaproteobacteria bacterium]